MKTARTIFLIVLLACVLSTVAGMFLLLLKVGHGVALLPPNVVGTMVGVGIVGWGFGFMLIPVFKED